MIEYKVVVDDSGNKHWYLNSQFHREDGPAIESANGDKYWLLNDKSHREDGPAIEFANGHKSWYLQGKPHREDGPAIERGSGIKYWYLNGENLTEAKFNKRFQKPCSDKVVEIDGVKYKLVKV